MISNRDLILEHQEQEYNDNGAEQYAQYEEDLAQLRYTVPPIDLGIMIPSIATSEQIASGIIEAIKEGRMSPLEFAVKRKCIEQGLELAFRNTEVKDMTITEVEKFGKEGATCLGATLKITNTRKYQYENDPTWKMLNDSIAETKDAIKAQEERVKIACKNNCSLIGDGGEIIASIVPAPETTSIAVSFKSKK
jgi:hypothetical protein